MVPSDMGSEDLSTDVAGLSWSWLDCEYSDWELPEGEYMIGVSEYLGLACATLDLDSLVVTEISWST